MHVHRRSSAVGASAAPSPTPARWTGLGRGRPGGQVSSGQRRRCLPELASLGGAYRREGEREGAAGSQQLEGERGSERGKLGGSEEKNEGRASERAPQPGRGRGRARRASAPAALRTPHRRPPADVSRAARRAPGTRRGGGGGGGGARAGARVSQRRRRARARTRGAASPPPAPPPRGSPGRARAEPGGGGAWGRARAAGPPGAGLLVNGSAGPARRCGGHRGSRPAPPGFLSGFLSILAPAARLLGCPPAAGAVAARDRVTSANARRQWV